MAMLWASPRPLLRPVVPRKLSLHGPTLRTCIQRRGLITLGIETSCDDTCVTVLQTKGDGTRQTAYLITNDRVTCANKHHQGIHPVEAVESHTRNLPVLLNRALENHFKPPPDLIAVTRGPGMKSCLNVGISFAKGLSVAWGVPLIGVHHMQAHALTPHLEAAIARGHNIDAHEPQYPFLTLLYGSTPPPPKKKKTDTTQDFWLMGVVFLLLRLGRVFFSEVQVADREISGFLVGIQCWCTPSQLSSIESWRRRSVAS